MKTGDYMKLTPEFMEAIVKELKRAAIAIELESGEGIFTIENIGDSKITITVTIESHAVVTGNQKKIV